MRGAKRVDRATVPVTHIHHRLSLLSPFHASPPPGPAVNGTHPPPGFITLCCLYCEIGSPISLLSGRLTEMMGRAPDAKDILGNGDMASANPLILTRRGAAVARGQLTETDGGVI